MIAKFNGRCKRCGGALPAGSVIEWTRDGGATHADVETCSAIRAAALAAPPVAEVTANGNPIVRFLQAAKDRGLKFPKARFLAPGGGELRLSVAGDTSRYPGAVQVKVDETWIGRIEANGHVAGPLASFRSARGARPDRNRPGDRGE